MSTNGRRRISPWALPVLVVLSLLVAGAAPARQADSLSAAVAEPDVFVTITPSGFEPDEVTVVPGQAIHWTNESGEEQSVTADSGLFDSGPIPPGGGFSMAVDVPGFHEYASSGDPDFAAAIQVILEDLPGPAADPAEEHVPDIPFPPVDEADLSVRDDFGVVASRTRILVGVTASATVAELNQALDAAGVAIAGGLRDSGILLVEAGDTSDFSGLDAAIDALRASSAVEFASMSPEVGTRAVPRAPEALTDDTTGAAANWSWIDRGPTGQLWAGDNWGMELSRAPEAWNLREAIQRKNPLTQTGIVDAGFQAHADLPALQIEAGLCTTFLVIFTGKCTGTAANDHGNHVAGIIGAAYDNDSGTAGRSRGVSGINPVARIHGASYAGFGGGQGQIVRGASLWDEILEVFDLVLDEKRVGGRLPHLRVINFSAGAAVFRRNAGVAVWWQGFPNANCGPGPNDDGNAGSTQWCSPNNQDAWIKAFTDTGKAARKIAERAAGLGVMIMQAVSNDSNLFCPPNPAPTSCNAVGASPPIVLNAANTSEFVWAERNWRSGVLPNPVLGVEAIGDWANTRPSLSRAIISDTGGDISAPGIAIFSSQSSDPGICPGAAGRYCTMGGASMATPHVTGTVGYLTAFDSSLTIPQIRQTLLTWAANDTLNGAQPRLDGFASVLSLNGAAKALADVNDMSKDGNRRLIYPLGAGPPQEDRQFSGVNGPDGKEYLTAPDGKIDMRDFRRFRDAWLQVCVDALATPAACPTVGDITLDGAAGHPKKDLNFDRCTYDLAGLDPANCATFETERARFDLNGDGAVDQATATVPLQPGGAPAANPGAATAMSDLDVLQSQWEATLANTEGYSAADLDTLMPSGDLEIHAQDFFDAGATEVDLAVSKAGGSLPDRTLAQADDFLVYTVPTEEVTIRGSAEVGGETLESAPLKVTLKPGEDRRVDLCVLHVDLSASRTRLPANGTATATVVAQLKGCPGDDVANKLMTFTLAPTGSGHATLNPTGGMTDADGKLTTTFTAGTEQTAYTLTATAELGDGKQAKGEIEITTLPVLTISYVWEQKTLNWSESGNTRWGAVAGMPDCTTAGVEYCIDSFTIGPHPTLPSSGLKRQGTLSGSESSFFLSESVINSLNRSQSSWTLSNPDGSNVRSATESAEWGVLASDANRYQNHGLPSTVRVEDRPEAVRLLGLKAVGELGYRHALGSAKTGDAEDPIELHSTRGEFLLAPRGDGSALRFAVDLSRPVEFKRQMDGTLKPYSFCGTFTKDLTTQPGYRVAQGSEWVPGAVDLTRKTTFAPGDRPMPVGPGSVTLRYAFAATAAFGATAPAPTLPDCSLNNPPDADFEYTPLAPKEGRVVRFFDRSTDPENNISKWSWTFGNGETSSTQDPHLLYHDNGDYNVGLHVEDTEGAANGPETKLVSVANEPPEAGLDDSTGQVGTAIKTSFRLWDPARADQASIDYELKRTDTGAVIASNAASAGRYTLTFPAGFFPSAGSFPFTLTATDKDGASASDTATITVTAEPPPPPPEEGPPTPTCDPTVTLDEQEQAFIEEVNAYRAENGLDPVVASPALTRASDRHVDDMVENDFLAHDGSDGSTPAQRAAEALYPSQTTGENLAFDFETAVDVLLGWKSSQTGHNENMLNPDWKAVGIARKEGPTTMPPDPPHDAWWWATMYGDVVDCPAPASMTSLSSSGGASKTANLSAGGGAGVASPEGELVTRTVAPPPLEAEPVPTLRVRVGETGTLAAASVAPALAAFTISDITPTADEPVTLTNASRDVAGDPVGGMLDVGNGPEAIVADGAVDITFPPGTFDVTLSVPKPGGGELAVTRSLTVTAPPLPSLSIADVLVNEANDAVFDVTLSAASDKTITVGFSTADGSARAPDDFAFTSGTLTFSPGQTAKTITVDVVDDLLDEPLESFSVNLAGAVDATIADAQGLGTLADNDAEPSVSIDDVTVLEGGSATFGATLSAPSGKLVTVGYSTSGGTATEDLDYTRESGTLIFSPGQISKMIDVLTTNDASDETDETFTMNLGAPLSNVAVADGQGVGTIDDNDGPTVSIAGPLFPVAEGNSGTTDAIFTISLSQASVQDVVVTYATGDMTAVAPQDYGAVAAGQLVITAGQTEVTVAIKVVGDTADEPDNEMFVVNLTSVLDGTIAVGTAVASIQDDDLPPPQPLPPPAPQGPPPDTVGPAVGIATAAVTASKKGTVPVRLTCPAGETLCAGILTLRSKGKIRLRPALERLVQVTFGRKAFTLQGGQTTPVTVKLSRKNRALLARLKKVRVLAIVEARDAAGNLQTTQATFLLRAPKK